MQFLLGGRAAGVAIRETLQFADIDALCAAHERFPRCIELKWTEAIDTSVALHLFSRTLHIKWLVATEGRRTSEREGEKAANRTEHPFQMHELLCRLHERSLEAQRR